jgi:hypothetical protein
MISDMLRGGPFSQRDMRRGGTIARAARSVQFRSEPGWLAIPTAETIISQSPANIIVA